MGVIRITKHEAPYVMLDKTALRDKRLSFRAKGLHAYLMSKPDDWTIHIEELTKQSPSDGRDAVAKGLKDLETSGYIRRQRIRDTKGRMTGWDTIVYETPLLAALADEDAQLTGDDPKPDLPTSDIPLSGDEPEIVDMSVLTPKPDLPTSDIPLSVTPKPDSPKPDLPNSANPQLLITETTRRTETTQKKEETPENADAFSSPAAADTKPSHRRKSTRRPTIPEWSDTLPWPDPLSLIALYHAFKPESWSAIEVPSDARLKIARAYLAQFPELDWWQRVFANIGASVWLCEGLSPNNRSLDWLLQKGKKDGIENCVKVAEGTYTKTHTPASPSPRRGSIYQSGPRHTGLAELVDDYHKERDRCIQTTPKSLPS